MELYQVMIQLPVSICAIYFFPQNRQVGLEFTQMWFIFHAALLQSQTFSTLILHLCG